MNRRAAYGYGAAGPSGVSTARGILAVLAVSAMVLSATATRSVDSDENQVAAQGQRQSGTDHPNSELARGTESVPVTASVPLAPDASWLDAMNYYRSLGGAPPVVENPVYTTGAQLHADYMAATLTVSHYEDPESPYYTEEGNRAANRSLLSYTTSERTQRDDVAGFVVGPFHALSLIRPSLVASGYGRAGPSSGYWFSVLDTYGKYTSAEPVERPWTWPGDGALIPDAGRASSETPSPITSCAGYTGWGQPVIARWPSTPTFVTTSWVDSQGSPVEHCEIDEATYTSPDSTEQAHGRGVLGAHHATVLLPREPLVGGETYSVTIGSGGSSVSWDFQVADRRWTYSRLSPETAWPLPGDVVSLLAEVRTWGGQVPVGSVTLIDGGEPLESTTLDALGRATFSYSPSAPGPHDLEISYGGSADHDPSNSESVRVTFTDSVNPFSSDTFGAENPAFVSPDVAACGDPVNCLTGNLFEDSVDLAVAGRGRDMSLARTYNSQAATGAQVGTLGPGWVHSFGAELSLDASGHPVVTQDNGSTARFAEGSTGYYGIRQGATSLEHNADGSFTHSFPDGSIDVFDGAGRLVQQSDRDGYVTSLSYADGQLMSVSDEGGRSLTFGYADGRLSSVSDWSGRTVSYAYDAAGDLVGVTDVDGRVTTYGYDPQHRLVTITDPDGGVVTNVYDDQDRVVSQTDAAGSTMTWVYDGLSTTITDGDGRVQVKTFDEGGNLVEQRRAVGTPDEAVWTYEYDVRGLMTRAVDPNGHVTTATWDDRGNLTSMTDPLGRTTLLEYDEYNQPVSITDATGVPTTLEYDGYGNVVTVSRPLVETGEVATTLFAYDPAHPADLVSMTDPTGRTWQYGYDTVGNLISDTDPLGRTTTFGYDAAGRQTSVTTPRGTAAGADPASATTTFDYLPSGLLTSVTDPDGNTVTATYDDAGRQSAVTLADGTTTRYGYDGTGKLIETIRPDGTTATTGYDAAGNVIRQVDGLGNVTSYDYDPLQRLAAITDPLLRVTRFGYDPAGNLTSRIDPSGLTTSYAYDDANQLTHIDYEDPETVDVTFAYDELGRRIEMTDGSSPYFDTVGRVTYRYDSLGRLVEHATGYEPQQTSFGYDTISYGYDLAGRLTELAYEDPSRTIQRSYDAAGQFVTVTDWRDRTTSFGYDPDGHLSTITYPNGLTSDYTWNDAGQITGIVHDNHGGTITPDTTADRVILNLTYTRDPAGRVATSNATGLDTERLLGYHYDRNGRLTGTGIPNPVAEIPVTRFGYDHADRLTRQTVGAADRTLTYDQAGQLVSRTAATGEREDFIYDPNGNRRTHALTVAGTTQNINAYAYDQENRLLRASDGVGSYAYHGDGLRADLTWDLSGPVPTIIGDVNNNRYIYGPGGLVIEQITLVDQDVYANVNGVEAGTSSTGTLWYHHDQLGSTRALSDGDGHFVTIYAYDSYGNPTVTGASIANPFEYAGGFTDLQSGLIYMRARWYDPDTAQFLTRDPILPLTQQPYSYANNDPINNTDPLGLFCIGTLCTPSLDDITSAASAVGGFVWENRGAIATGVAIGACLAPPVGWVGCAALHGTAFAFRAWELIDEQGFSASADQIAVDALLTSTTLALGGAFEALAGPYPVAAGPYPAAIRPPLPANPALGYLGRLVPTGYDLTVLLSGHGSGRPAC